MQNNWLLKIWYGFDYNSR